MSSRWKIALKLIGIFVFLFIILHTLMMVTGVREFVFSSTVFSKNYRYLSVILPLGLSIVTAYLGYLLAERKNRDRRAWAAACFFLNIWGLMVLYFLPSLSRRK
jgi:hypothetical protein